MANPTLKQMSPESGHGLRWGEWLRRRATHLGLLTPRDLANAAGCSLSSAANCVAADTPSRNMHYHLRRGLGRALRVDEFVLLRGWATILPEDGITAVVSQRLEDLWRIRAASETLDDGSLFVLAEVAEGLAAKAKRGVTYMAALRRQLPKHVGDAGQGTGEGAGPMVPGDQQEDGRQSQFHPAPAEAPARAFDSSGAHAPRRPARAASPRRDLSFSPRPAAPAPGAAG